MGGNYETRDVAHVDCNLWEFIKLLEDAWVSDNRWVYTIKKS